MNVDPVTLEFQQRHRLDCAAEPVTLRQYWRGLLLAAGLIFLLIYRWDLFLLTVTVWLSAVYLASAVFRGVSAWLSLRGKGEVRVSQEDLLMLEDDSLPVYTVLLPLFREANIADKIVRRIAALDYPKEKLDVKLLLEESDRETRQAVERCSLPPWFEVIVVPDSQPKTKPRACNYGLRAARGELCVIYDAEDRPDPDQLKKAALAFRQAPPRLACLQAKLNYYNADQNLLTRLFTVEYSTTFDVLLPGQSVLRLPLPLGGTSNHFRTGILREIGGWDPFNVTEDCDLGIRIYEKGYHTAVLESTTWEEANSRWWNWIRQRSRWVKGFIQTHFVHTRSLSGTVARLGWRGTFGFFLGVGAGSLMMVINVFYWVSAAFYGVLLFHGVSHGLSWTQLIVGPHDLGGYEGIAVAGLRLEAWPLFYWGPQEDPTWAGISLALFIVSAVLLLANFMFLGIHLAGCLRRRFYRLAPYVLLMPFYWVLISIAAWKGLWQFFTKPFYWEKTIHGLDQNQPTAPMPVGSVSSTKPEI